MAGDRRPGGEGAGHRLRRAENIGEEGQRRAEAVIARLVDKTAAGGEKAPQLAARLVKDAGRRPALRAAHDCRRPVFASHPRQLPGHEIERALPADCHKRLAPAADAAVGPVFEPPGAHQRGGDAGRRMDRVWECGDQRRRVGIEGERDGADDTTVGDGVEGAPMRMLRHEAAAPGGGRGGLRHSAAARGGAVWPRPLGRSKRPAGRLCR
jgi:hypothetical protein